MKKRRDDTSDADAFAREMADVVPLAPDPRGRKRATPPVTLPPPVEISADDEDGSQEDFVAAGVDRREVRKLKRGDYVAADRLDLHGMTAAEARTSVGRFVDRSRYARHRCVCIVHGRGLHSAAQVGVLKARVRADLRSNRSVLAYADAPRADGGSGAAYVLLRK